MFKKQKLILEKNKKVLEENNKVLENIQKEKEELLEIKRMLEDNSEKVNITNVFLLNRNGHYNFVELKSEKIQGPTNRSRGKIVVGYHSELIDIFSRVIIYEKNSVKPIQSEEYMADRYGDCYIAYLYPVTMVDKNLLKYVDNMVPKIVLQRLFYKVNNIDITNNKKILSKNK